MRTRPATRLRPFFILIGALCLLVAAVGFGPNVYEGLSGAFVIPAIVHVHAAIMTAWLATYLLQAILAVRGDLARHRRLGRAAAVLAVFVWASMAVVTVTALRRFDPEEYGFLVQPLLTQLGLLTIFPIFVAWGLAARRRPEWHKRLMTLATVSLVQAALDRIHWLPDEGLPAFWHFGIRTYTLFLLPMLAYDLATRRRIHPATLAGAGITIAMHGVVSTFWDHQGWHQVARGFWMWLRA